MTTVPTVPNFALPADRRQGFTLIEMLVTVTVMLVVIGGGLAAMLTFNSRQALQNAAKNLQTSINGAKSRARLGDLPTACYDNGEALEGYQVTLTDGSPTVTVAALCVKDAVTREEVTNTITLANNVVSQTSVDLVFGSLYGGTAGATTITLESGGITPLLYTFEVTSEGEVTSGSFE